VAAVQGLLAASHGTATDENTNTVSAAPMSSTLDVGPGNDLSQLVELRAKNQSREAAESVRVSWKTTPEDQAAEPEKKAPSERQLLAKKINDAIKLNAEQGSSTGLNRQVRWGKNAAGSAAGDGSVTGNSANAQAAARSGATAVCEKISMLKKNPILTKCE